MHGSCASFDLELPLGPKSLLREHLAGEALDQAMIEWFAGFGVSTKDLAKNPHGGFIDKFVRHQVVWLPHGRFEYATYCRGGEGEPALCVVVRDVDAIPVDVVAWEPRTGRLATLNGYACLLGQDMLNAPRLDPGLRVCRDPLAWLQRHRQGVVILDEDRAANRLCNTGLLIVGDEVQACDLHEMFLRSLPRIFVEEAAA